MYAAITRPATGRRAFTILAQEAGVQRGNEPQRLLDQKEYRAAIIAAMTNLEAPLRERLDKQSWTDVRRPLALRALVERAIAAQILPQESRELVFSWIKLRNEAVHTPKPVTRAEAKAVVDGVERILALT